MLRLAYFVELTWLLVDMVSGYLQNSGIYLPGEQTVSGLIRLGVVGLLIAILLLHHTRERLLTLSLMSLCLVWVIAHGIADALVGKENIATDIQLYLKLMLPLLLFRVMQLQLEKGVINIVRIRNIIVLNATILMLNLSLGLLGIGFGNYGVSETGELLGSKGFFYAGNEVSATLIAIFALMTFIFRERLHRNMLEMLAAFFLFFIASLMSLSKTSLIGFLMVLAFAVNSYLSRAAKVKFCAVAAVATVVAAPWWLPLMRVSIERWQFFWDLKPDFFDFITSGRTERIESYISWLTGGGGGMHILFGQGLNRISQIGSFENDLLDLTMGSGILGLLFYCVWAEWAWSGLTNRVTKGLPNGMFTFYFVGTFLVLSVIAGHVIYSAMLAPFIALIAVVSSRNFSNATSPTIGTIPR